MPKSIHLVLIITGLNTGGAEMMLLKLLQRIDRHHFSPSVITLTTCGTIGPKLTQLGIPVFALGMRPNLPSPLAFLRLLRLLKQLKPDLVHTWMYHADLLGGLAARLVGIRSVVWCLRNSDLSAQRSKWSTRLVVRVCAYLSACLPQAILSCSKRAASVHVALGYAADKIQIIPNGFDLAHWGPDSMARVAVRAELGVDAETPLVGLIARADPQKNHLGFIQAAVRVQQALPQVHFVLAGKGIDASYPQLMQAIAAAGLQAQVHLLGPRDDIPHIMAALDVLASSSFGEAFPNVLGEAMACALPCVVTDVGDSAEIVGESGRVVAAGDMTGLAQHLIEILQLPSAHRAHLGAQARQRVRDCYEIVAVVQQYENFYIQLLNRNERVWFCRFFGL